MGFKIENFNVIRDNQTVSLGGGTTKNIGCNKLKGFRYNIVPDI